MRTVVAALAGLVLAAGCAERSPAPSISDAAPVAVGNWRAVVTLPGGELPFTLELGDEGGATVINGSERVLVSQATVNDAEMTLVFPAYNVRIDSTRDGPGFAGSLTLVKRGGKKQVMPFTAEPGVSHRFVARPSTDNDVSGRWAVTFVDDDGKTTEAVGEFVQDGTTVTGTFLTPTGDYRFLAGDLDGDDLYLSTFDGAHAFLFTARLEDGQLAGDFWSGTAWHESWTAQRDEQASLPDADKLTQLVAEDFEFEFPDTDGQMVSLDDERFAGKVVVVALAGSWCPNCHDEAAFLAPFYKQYRDRGLEIVGLMFEHLEDFDEAARQVEAFRDKFGIEYPLLVAGSSDKQRAGETMSVLDRIYAYPTSIFIDRSGEVRRIHTGFTGPGTGEHYDRLIAGFTQTVEELLEE